MTTNHKGQPYIHSDFVDGTKTMSDERGEWQSSIYRDPVEAPLKVTREDLAGDCNTQSYHGGPELAICCHFMDHYRFWKQQHGIDLTPGSVDENWTLENVTEDELCIGDIYRVGSALVQVSAPRSPCESQSRRIGRPELVKLTLQVLQTGIYLRVLEPGMIQAGGIFHLAERLNQGRTVPILNRCFYHDLDKTLAKEFSTMKSLMPNGDRGSQRSWRNAMQGNS